MEIRELFADDKAVSPVIGVILMVAITVILAAVIGTFVLGLGDQVSSSAPQASFTFDFEEGGTGTGTACTGTTDLTAGGGSTGDLTVTHDGGDEIEKGDLSLTDGTNTAELSNCGSLASDLTAGTSFYVNTDSATTVRVIWSSGGGDTNTLAKWTGPDA